MSTEINCMTFLIFRNTCILFYLQTQTHTHTPLSAMAHVEVRGQLVGGGSHFLPCGLSGLNSGLQAWQQVPLPIVPS